jgi:hypothetical protein
MVPVAQPALEFGGDDPLAVHAGRLVAAGAEAIARPRPLVPPVTRTFIAERMPRG